mmetsp:Transcript_18949/g.48841  ORF Transcript_18949/g.48841 Transcript_18949/m.48841 type:complete len:249 (+) Transcript_18949:407-1153(+)
MVLHKRLVQLKARRLHRDAVPASREHKRVAQIGWLAALLGVHAHELEVLPDLVEKHVVVELVQRGEHCAMRLRADALHLLYGSHVDLVVHIQAFDVVPVSLDHVAEVVDGEVLAHKDLGVVYAVLVQDIVDVLLGDRRRLAREVDRDAARCLPLVVDVGRALIQSQPAVFELAFEQHALVLRVARRGIEDHEHHVRRLSDGDDLAPAALALRRALDDPWQVEHLDAAPLVVEDARDARERREFVRGRL